MLYVLSKFKGLLQAMLIMVRLVAQSSVRRVRG